MCYPNKTDPLLGCLQTRVDTDPISRSLFPKELKQIRYINNTEEIG